MRRLTSCGSRGAETNPPVHRRSVPFWIQYASRSVFPRSLSSALRDCRGHGGRTFSFARCRMMRLCIAERSGAGDMSSSPRVAVLWSRHLLHAVCACEPRGPF